ncbi:hypothetical protein [Gallibacterium anatis]|uniref:hypothetical protein n=1 Tax=Gallibacterium anatis TaxID=750 RepID=UPI00057D6A11|nr:hypothetical protein [Gallibacterium anatis]
MIEKNSIACTRLVQLVSDFSTSVKAWESAIRYQTKPDEIHDITLISQRVYGRRNEYLVIMAAAGLSTFDEPLKEQVLILPTEAQLQYLKQRAGFENNERKRDFNIEEYR